MELEALAESVSKIQALGASLVLVSPQKQEHNRAVGEEEGLSVEILSDPGNEVAAGYGIRFKLPEDLKQVYLQFNIDLPVYNGDDTWTLPMPCRVIIDQTGIVRSAEINPDYTVRPDPQDTVEALSKIVNSR